LAAGFFLLLPDVVDWRVKVDGMLGQGNAKYHPLF
jgi:hypothetical protein